MGVGNVGDFQKLFFDALSGMMYMPSGGFMERSVQSGVQEACQGRQTSLNFSPQNVLRFVRSLQGALPVPYTGHRLPGRTSC